MCDMATYRPVKNFPGYRVGDDGTIWSRWRNGGNDRTSRLTSTWHQLKGWVDKRRGQQTGYIKVGLMRKGKLYHRRLHQLILEAFVGPCSSGKQTRHLDDCKANNALSNLVWGTATENANDSYANGLKPVGEHHHKSRLTLVQVKEIRVLLADGVSERKIASMHSVSRGAISNIKRKTSWNHGNGIKEVANV